MRRHANHNEGPNFQRQCVCFDDDINFFSRSFTRPNAGRVQYFDKRDGEVFVRDSNRLLAKPKTWLPRSSTNPDFFDPLHKEVLTFHCYADESDGEEGELLRIRPMRLLYHLDDETFSLVEPFVNNSGHIQGRVFHRQPVPRKLSKRGDSTWTNMDQLLVGPNQLTWRDVRIGEDVHLFGRRYRVVSCDQFTAEFLQDRGHPVPGAVSEPLPVDAWSMQRRMGKRLHFPGRVEEQRLAQLHVNEDADLRSWELMPKRMVFLAAWLDAANDFHNARTKRTFRLLVDTSDDLVTVVETTSPGFGNQVFLRSTQLPYTTQDGRHKHYRAHHLRPGCWIEVFKRQMFIYDCEGEETHRYLQQQYGVDATTQWGQCSVDLLKEGPPAEQVELRPAQMIWRAENREFPRLKFLIVYDLVERRVDICEESRAREWSKGRPFLLDISAKELNEKKLKPGENLSLFRWNFTIVEPHPSTKRFLDGVEENQSRNDDGNTSFSIPHSSELFRPGENTA